MFFDPLAQSENIKTAYPPVTETLPRSSLGYSSNNVYAGFPPIMTDGRALIASYQPEAQENSQLVKDSGIKSNWQYRKYLTENATQIAEQNFKEACNDTGYTQRFSLHQRTPDDKIRNTPFVYPSYLDASTPSGYSSSDLKNLYLSREQLTARKNVPSVIS